MALYKSSNNDQVNSSLQPYSRLHTMMFLQDTLAAHVLCNLFNKWYAGLTWMGTYAVSLVNVPRANACALVYHRLLSSSQPELLVIIDRFSHLVLLHPAKGPVAVETADGLWRWITTYGIPARVTSDGGSAFASKLVSDALKLIGTEHHISIPHHPEGHGAVERANYTVTQVLRAVFHHRPHWVPLTAAVAMAVNAAPSRILGTSPFEVVFAQKPRMPLHQAVAAPVPSQPATATPDDADDDRDPLDRMRELPRIAQVIFEEVRKREKEEYAHVRRRLADQTPGNHHRYRTGAYVLLLRPPAEKLDFRWKAPYLIVNKISERE